MDVAVRNNCTIYYDSDVLVHSLTYSNEMGSIGFGKSASTPTPAANNRLTYWHTFKHFDDLKKYI